MLCCGGSWITKRHVAGRFLLGFLIAVGFVIESLRACRSWFASCVGALENMAVMQQAVQHCSDGGTVAEQLTPVFHWTI